jgi:fibronectin type 3 domain-containing protein
MCEVKQSEKKVLFQALRICVILVMLFSVLVPMNFLSENVDAADSFEPDDNPSLATTISVDGTLQSHDFDPDGEEDWFKFTATSGKLYVIETHNLIGGADTYLNLYDIDGSTLLKEDDDAGEGWASLIAWIATGDGIFYVMCEDRLSNGGFYDINITEMDPPPLDSFEPDDDDATATLITTDGTLQNHSFHLPDDQDWLKFSGVENTVYLMETHNVTMTNTGIVLFDTDGSTFIAANDDGGIGLASRIIWKATKTGVFYLVVMEVNSSFGESYTYDINISETVEPPGDSFENDNGFEDANSIAADGTIQNHSFHLSGDEDWIAFDAVFATHYGIETHNLYQTDTRIYLYDSDGITQLKENDNGGSGPASYLFWTAPRNDTFYIKVMDYFNSAGPNCTYEINISVAQPLPGDAYETDNIPAHASPILTDGNLQSHTFHTGGDEDWINFTAFKNYQYIIETHNLGNCDTEVSLYDTDGVTRLEYADDGGIGSASKIEWTAFADGNYYVRIEELFDHFGDSRTYDINISIAYIPELPSAPLNMVATSGASYVNLSWDVPSSSGSSSITNYVIYRNTTSGAKDLLMEIGNLTYYNDTTVTNFATYYYEVCAKSQDGEGDESNEVSALPFLPPSSPTSVAAIPGQGTINITWNPPSSDGGSPVTNYTVYRKSLFSMIPIATVENATFYNDTNVFYGFTYYYSVSANNIGGEGPLANEVTAKMVSPPGIPWFITISRGVTHCRLDWYEPFSSGSSPITNYRIYKSAVSGEDVFLVEIGNTTTYNDTDVTIGNTYYYKISARNIGGEGELSEEVTAIMGTLPGAPTKVNAEGGELMGVSFITVTWLPPADTGGIPITNYKVYRGTTSNEYIFLADVGNITLYIDSDIDSKTKYYYMIVAENDMGTGVGSLQASTTPEVIEPPSILPLLALIGIIAVVVVVIVLFMILRKKKGKKKEEEAQIGFQGDQWDGQQPPPPAYLDEQAPLQDGSLPRPSFSAAAPNATEINTYKCPLCLGKFTAERPNQDMVVACPICNGNSVIGPDQ